MQLRARAERLAWLFVRARLIRGRFRSTTYRYGALRGGEALVLMCLWNRPSRITSVLELLDAQDNPGGVRLFLWNNKRSEHQLYTTALRQFPSAPDGALRRVDLVRSPINFGSIARFFWARKINRARPGVPVIVLDDDQDFGPTLVRESLRLFEPTALKAWWAWTVGDGYWDRRPAEVGDRVDHIGPGGMVCSSDIFADSRFFTEIPDEFRLLDDVWLTYFAKREGYTLGKLPVDIRFVMDESNQFHGQTDLKWQFFDYLYAPERGRS